MRYVVVVVALFATPAWAGQHEIHRCFVAKMHEKGFASDPWKQRARGVAMDMCRMADAEATPPRVKYPPAAQLQWSKPGA